MRHKYRSRHPERRPASSPPRPDAGNRHPRLPIHSAPSLTCPGTRPSGARGRRLQSRGRGPGSEHRRGERATRAGRERAAQAGGVPEQQGRAEPPRALIHAGHRRLLRRADEPGRAGAGGTGVAVGLLPPRASARTGRAEIREADAATAADHWGARAESRGAAGERRRGGRYHEVAGGWDPRALPGRSQLLPGMDPLGPERHTERETTARPRGGECGTAEVAGIY